jgi:hypothetical protein
MEKIRVSEVHMNEGLMLRGRRSDDFSIAKIMGSKKLISETEAAAAPGNAGAKTAAKPAANPAAKK